MKKFTLTLLLLLAGIPTLFAQQTVRNDIFAYLKHEGYAPALDKDSDIEFKIQGILYNIIVKQIENEDYAYVEVLANFGTVTPYDKLMEIANDINQNKFVCKCSVSRNENRNVFTLAMEFVTNSRASFWSAMTLGSVMRVETSSKRATNPSNFSSNVLLFSAILF